MKSLGRILVVGASWFFYCCHGMLCDLKTFNIKSSCYTQNLFLSFKIKQMHLQLLFFWWNLTLIFFYLYFCREKHLHWMVMDFSFGHACMVVLWLMSWWSLFCLLVFFQSYSSMLLSLFFKIFLESSFSFLFFEKKHMH